jgi:hypothetical protein
MFHIESLDQDGNLLEVVTEVPAFFALYHNSVLVGYFITVEACRNAANDILEVFTVTV